MLGSAYCSILVILNNGLSIGIESTLDRSSRDPKPTTTAVNTRSIFLMVNTDFCLNDFDMIKNPIKSPKNHSSRKDLCIKPPTTVIIMMRRIRYILRFLNLIPTSFIIGRAANEVIIARRATEPNGWVNSWCVNPGMNSNKVSMVNIPVNAEAKINAPKRTKLSDIGIRLSRKIIPTWIMTATSIIN